MGDAGEQLADQQEEIQVEADVYFWPIVTFSLCVHALSIFRLFKWQEKQRPHLAHQARANPGESYYKLASSRGSLGSRGADNGWLLWVVC